MGDSEREREFEGFGRGLERFWEYLGFGVSIGIEGGFSGSEIGIFDGIGCKIVFSEGLILTSLTD